MTRAQLIAQIQAKKSVLCVGLDPDMDKMPAHFPRTAEGLADFCCAIIDATAPYAVAYKPNLAFFEALGVAGWQALARVADHLRRYPHHLSIADAKRGDIGNTATKYAQGILNELGFDAITVAPYMGQDSLQPFALPGKWGIALGLTSNPGANDFQLQSDGRWPSALCPCLGCLPRLDVSGAVDGRRRCDPPRRPRFGPGPASRALLLGSRGRGPGRNGRGSHARWGDIPVIWAC